jgi:hypothetical protein
MSIKFDNDTTKTRQGDNYHYLIALEKCINAKEGEVIYIEQKGDIATDESSIEVKHHENEKHKISDNHIDFWKTLKNWVNNYEVIKNCKYLILLTTSQIQEKSQLANWNKSTKNEKLKILTELKNQKEIPTNIKKFVETIFDFSDKQKHNEDRLIEIIDKFTISHGHLTIQKKIDEVLENPLFTTLNKQRRRDFLDMLLSYISAEGRNNPEDWRIDVSSFKSHVSIYAPIYVRDTQPIPDLYKNADTDINKYSEYVFVKEMKNIEIDNSQMQDAICDYFRAFKTGIYLNENDPLFDDKLSDYQNNIILKDISIIKSKYQIDIDDFEDNKQIKKQSKKTFYDAISMELRPINGYSPNQVFFQRGTIHIIVNSSENDFTWQFRKPT